VAALDFEHGRTGTKILGAITLKDLVPHEAHPQGVRADAKLGTQLEPAGGLPFAVPTNPGAATQVQTEQSTSEDLKVRMPAVDPRRRQADLILPPAPDEGERPIEDRLGCSVSAASTNRESQRRRKSTRPAELIQKTSPRWRIIDPYLGPF
jgi:hypothetical protein